MLQKVAALFVFAFWAGLVNAQSWVQIEAQPGTERTLERAQAYADVLPDVNAFRTGTNWNAIALGPYATEDDARLRLLQLRAQRLVPADSFVSDGRTFRDRIFGTGIAIAAPATTETATPAQPEPVLEPGEETIAQARRGERDLTREDRADIQTALRFAGFYNSVIDAAFGPGTRRAMSNWQVANGYEGTGVLTSLQRRELVESYRSVLASLGLSPVVDTQAGIEIDMPTALVSFDRYEAPFAHYAPATDDGVQVVLISLSGDAGTLAAYFDIMQMLEIVPADGNRTLGRESFTIEGENSRIRSHTYARRAGDAIKGFILVWPAGDDKRFRIALDAMQASFGTTDAVLPDSLGTGAQNIDLLSGLEIRRPEKSRSGFYIDSAGAVLTTADAVRQCRRITLGEDIEADVVAENAPLGLALLKPRQTIAPISIARMAVREPRLQSDVAVAGYSYGGLLSLPTLTFGTLADLKGLDGDDRVQRLSLASTPGDAGGPVFDGSGAVIGMLLDRENGAKQLPEDVTFAADAPVLVEFLTENGVNPAAADAGADIAPEDLTLLAADLTVVVNCWN
ncbi:MAG: trypsin-like peptidase domain-containing protein [Silicimonas sp.]|jgi:peptidoglycan hydrolase-like protein with peptidoglycan-binding domain|nr:trypsin-like peptidase domain-containing protein [Silicimonas sp.]